MHPHVMRRASVDDIFPSSGRLAKAPSVKIFSGSVDVRKARLPKLRVMQKTKSFDKHDQALQNIFAFA